VPFTPFHFGPGLLLAQAAADSFTAFALVTLVIDIESGYHLATGAYPVHTFLHTALGATLVALGVVVALAGREWRARRCRPVNPDGTRRSPRALQQVAIGGLAGAWSHVLLDGIVHADAHPLAPWSDANPLLGVINAPALLIACVACAALALTRFLRKLGTINC